MKKVYMVTDLGPGDGGKGGVVHKIAHMQKAHTIVKVGGAQGSHGVRTSSGQSFAFSQFGCGTFEGVKTHLSPRFVMDPVGIINEATALRYEAGVHDPFSLMTIDGSTLCNTPFHGIASRIKELSLGDAPRGTVGTGVGQAYRQHEAHPELSIFARDLASPQLRAKLAAVRAYVVDELQPLITGEFLPVDQALLADDLALLHDHEFLDHVVEQFKLVAQLCMIVDTDYFAEDLLGKDGVIVVESSHGVLTDSQVGFHPHTSALRTLPNFTRAMFDEAGYDGKIVSLGVHRAYSIRHGAGPLPTHDPTMSELLLPGSNKDTNRWQGKVRVGPLDLVLLRYAIEASGPDAYDGLAITWFDQVMQNGQWDVCDWYSFDAWRGETWPARNLSDMAETLYQDIPKLTTWLKGVKPQIELLSLPDNTSRDQIYDLVAKKLLDRLGVPVRMISFGPTEQDKLCK